MYRSRFFSGTKPKPKPNPWYRHRVVVRALSGGSGDGRSRLVPIMLRAATAASFAIFGQYLIPLMFTTARSNPQSRRTMDLRGFGWPFLNQLHLYTVSRCRGSLVCRGNYPGHCRPEKLRSPVGDVCNSHYVKDRGGSSTSG